MIRSILIASLTLGTWAAHSLLPANAADGTEALFATNEHDLIQETEVEDSLVAEFAALRAADAPEQDQAPHELFFGGAGAGQAGEDDLQEEIARLTEMVDRLQAEKQALLAELEERESAARDLQMQELDLERALAASTADAEHQLADMERALAHQAAEFEQQAAAWEREHELAARDWEHEFSNVEREATQQLEHLEREIELQQRDIEREFELAMREAEREMEMMEREFERAEREFERSERAWEESERAWEESEQAWDSAFQGECWDEVEVGQGMGGFFGASPDALPGLLERVERLERSLEARGESRDGCCCCCKGKSDKKQTVSFGIAPTPRSFDRTLESSRAPRAYTFTTTTTAPAPAPSIYPSRSAPVRVAPPCEPAAPQGACEPAPPCAPAAPSEPCAPEPSAPEPCAPEPCDESFPGGVTLNLPAAVHAPGAPSQPAAFAATTVGYAPGSVTSDEQLAAEVESMITEMMREVRDLQAAVRSLRAESGSMR